MTVILKGETVLAFATESSARNTGTIRGSCASLLTSQNDLTNDRHVELWEITSARDNDYLWPIVLYAFDLLLLLGGDFCTQSFLLRSELGSELSTEILRLKHRADFHLRPAIKRRALQPFHRLVDRPNLPKPEAGNQLLCLGKWA